MTVDRAADRADELRGNRILAGLPDPEFERMLDLLTVVDVGTRHSVVRPGEPITEIHFPLTSIYSMVAAADGAGPPVEVATVGYEGMVGLPLFLGVMTSPNAVFTQVAGRSAVLAGGALAAFLGSDGALHGLLHRYTQLMLVQVSQTVVCNNAHAVEQRAARWLLMTADRVRADQFALTQEFLGQMLGVRRQSVSEVASRLQADGLIRYRRGVVSIVDRPALEDVACDCYRIVRAEFGRVAG
jgi:CRP-like cAMP-binding protein